MSCDQHLIYCSEMTDCSVLSQSDGGRRYRGHSGVYYLALALCLCSLFAVAFGLSLTICFTSYDISISI